MILFDIEKEIQIISSAFISSERLNTLLEWPIEIFHSDANKKVISAMAEIIEDYDNVDSLNLVSYFKNQGNYKEYEPLIQKIITGQYPLNITYELNYIKSLYLKKRSYELSKDLETSKINFETYHKLINELYDGLNVSKTDRTDFGEFLKDVDLDDIFKKGNYILTGITPLDEKITGFFDGQLIVIAARPGVGKSTLAWQIAQNINEGVVFFSLEMGRAELYAKSLSMKANVPVYKIESQNLKQDEIARVTRAHLEYKKKMKLVLYDKDENIIKIKSLIKQEVKKGARVIFIDYLQLITGGRGNNTNERIQNITQGLKNLSRTLDIPIILLSQLNREVEKHERFPVKSDLRDSGAIEQDADVIVFIHEKAEETFLLVAKNRKGPTGKIIDEDDKSKFDFQKTFSKFEWAEFNYNKEMGF
jgi:replicative DNA helicase